MAGTHRLLLRLQKGSYLDFSGRSCPSKRSVLLSAANRNAPISGSLSLIAEVAEARCAGTSSKRKQSKSRHCTQPARDKTQERTEQFRKFIIFTQLTPSGPIYNVHNIIAEAPHCTETGGNRVVRALSFTRLRGPAHAHANHILQQTILAARRQLN